MPKDGRSGGRLSSIFTSSQTNLHAPQTNSRPQTNSKAVPPITTSLSPNVPPTKLTKAGSGHERSASGQSLSPATLLPPAQFSPPTVLRKPLPHASTENLLSPSQVPPAALNNHARSPTSPVAAPSDMVSSRPTTPLSHHSGSSTAPTPSSAQAPAKKRSSWLSGGGGGRGSSRPPSRQHAHSPRAWILGHPERTPYDIDALISAQKVTELWNEQGNTFVHLFPRMSGKGPSFCLPAYLYGASTVLSDLARKQNVASFAPRTSSLQARTESLSLGSPSTPPMTPELRAQQVGQSHSPTSFEPEDGLEDSDEPVHLWLPIGLSTDGAVPSPGRGEASLNADDVDQIVAVRNTFAFLLGQSLIATERRPNAFAVFLQIAAMLQHWGFTNVDGSTYGEIASSSFDSYVEELGLADVRTSREKTIEAVVLGEKMRSVMLYNEAFVHCVGKYEDVTKLNNPKFAMISPRTKNRMERASMDLYLRRQNIETRLKEFDFPSIFGGIMNSKTDDARRSVNFETWKSSFLAMRKFFQSYYKSKYGAWPPKASSKKNSLETSGLNRIVLKDLYHDLCNLYDLLVDRDSLTTRGDLLPTRETDQKGAETQTSVLRRILHEYDRSTPPEQPPVPFDIPILPHPDKTRGAGAKIDVKALTKKVKSNDLVTLLKNSINQDSNLQTPFLTAFKDFEHKALHSKSTAEICDIRCGEWVFLYAVLQALPMLVVDAPGIKWTRHVEYFLCEPPRSGVPWAREETRGPQRNWYNIAGGGVVNLPSDVIEHGIEGVYRRSHCWQAAARWTANNPVLAAAVNETLDHSLPAPPVAAFAATGAGASKPESPGARSNRSSVINLGLDALPIPQGVAPPSPSARPTSAVDSSKTFDAILGAKVPAKGKRK